MVEMKDLVIGEVKDSEISGLFFAIGHEPATKFLDRQLEVDADGYVVTESGTTKTSVKGVFTAGDVQELKYRQVVTAAASGLLTKFLDGQLEVDADGYVVNEPGTIKTSVNEVFAAGDVQELKYRQAVTAAASGHSQAATNYFW